jgi:lipoprotein-anchoring transpeptidase ErfK/SrfK
MLRPLLLSTITAALAWSASPASANDGATYQYGDPLYYGSANPWNGYSYSNPAQTIYRPQAAPTTRQVVRYDAKYGAGTIVISTAQRRLYYVLGNGQAIQYTVGVGRPGFAWSGTKSISMKREWPDWRPPREMLQRRPDLPRHMAGGPNNPLGARAMYLGSSLYRIHGSNEPHTMGQAVSSGCIRMTNSDVIDLYRRAQVGTRVVVL